MTVNRRTFLHTLTAAAAAAGGVATGLTAGVAAADSEHQPVPQGGIGMHLYTMRSVLATDYPGTLRTLAGIGYRTLGVSGRFGHSAAAIRGFADDAGLTIVLEHVGYDRIANNWAGAVADQLTLGGRWVVISSLPGSLRTPAGYRRAAAEFNEAGRIAHDAGLKLLYHNHDFDFARVDGQVLFDILVEQTDPRYVGFELDLYWCVRGGQDPIHYFTTYPRRFPALHVKDMAPNGGFADVGSGVLDFPAMFDHARTGGVQQWLVEHDTPADPFATARNSYNYLSTVRY